jgi:uncharacterized protein DUF5110
VYPHGESAFTLYEDDGISYSYLEGEVATTQICCQSDASGVTLEIGARQGTYDGMPTTRGFSVRLHLPQAPKGVEVDGEECTDWTYADGVVRVHVAEAAERDRGVRVVCRC